MIFFTKQRTGGVLYLPALGELSQIIGIELSSVCQFVMLLAQTDQVFIFEIKIWSLRYLGNVMYLQVILGDNTLVQTYCAEIMRSVADVL